MRSCKRRNKLAAFYVTFLTNVPTNETTAGGLAQVFVLPVGGIKRKR